MSRRIEKVLVPSGNDTKSAPRRSEPVERFVLVSAITFNGSSKTAAAEPFQNQIVNWGN
jgi:hypothetical protein